MTRDAQEGLFEAPAPAADPAPAQTSRPRTTAGFAVAAHDPVASVRLIGVLPHLDRPFDYAVPATLDAAGPGMRVKVRFSGREHDGIVLARGARASTDRPLAPLARLVSEDVVISPDMLRVCEEVAERSAGSVGDVLRLAIPPRHARAEKSDRAAEEKESTGTPAPPEDPAPADETGLGEESSAAPADDLLTAYAGLPALVSRAGDPQGPVPRAAVVLEPAHSWDELTARAIQALPEGAGALVIAPDQRDVQRLHRCLDAHGIAHEVLASADGPEKRYRAFRRILRGASRVVIGNRSAAFAPVADLALAICLDPADDLLVEPRAPYPHLRTILQSRSAQERCALLLVSRSLDPQTLFLAENGYLHLLPPVPAPLTAVRPHIEAMDEYLREREGPSGRSRMPQQAMRVLREGMAHGPVLVQVPRSGYVPAVACTFCGTRCRCPQCAAPLVLRGRGGGLQCTVCGRREDAYRCPECSRTQVRALVIGSARTAEELRRAFPDAPFRVAGGAQGPVPDDDVPDGAIVVATPGAEPAPPAGFAAALLLDADAMLARAAFDADVEAVRRWSNAIALVRPQAEGGRVLIVGTSTLPAIRDLVAHRSRVFLDRVMEDRRALDLPPISKVAEVVGDRPAVRSFLAQTALPDGTDDFGPVDVPEEDDRIRSRAVLRLPVERSRELADALRAGIAARSAHKDPGSLRVRLDPPDVF
ncbi:primosomal protein N' family DNA-binding protein [Brachybacterium subflavum]|uniref:primosomal protein N' family DNA-binding protein n=1 Tax=Brachybacterium subflavum TaxID=2585206 RepID=UPI0012662A83|nr:primosomal protein N' [Brachybacterium subflavum]